MAKIKKQDKLPLIVAITDTHLKEDNIELVKSIFKQTIAYCKQYKIEKIIHLGDVFHSRKAQNQELVNAFVDILDMLADNWIKMYVIPGNHDKTDYKSEKSFLNPYKHHPALNLVTNRFDMHLSGFVDIIFHFIPFFDEKETYSKYLENEMQFLFDKPKKSVLITHIGVNQVKLSGGKVYENEIDSLSFEKFDKVFVGHFHDTAKIRNIEYIGAAYQQNFGENDDKGPILLYDDLSWIRLKVDFPKYVKFEARISQMKDAEINASILQETSLGNFVKLSVIGNEAELKSFDFKTLQDHGVDINFKQEAFAVEQQEMQVELQEFTDDIIGENFVLFCSKNNLSLTEGAEYLNEININVKQNETGN